MTTDNALDLHVLVPSGIGGVVVITVADLIERMEEGHGLEHALSDGGIDSTMNDDPAALISVVQAVRGLNETGDADHYWKIR